jgi:hypothetical protein
MTTSPEIVLPPLPKPWTAASTLKCVSCGAPYEPARALAPHAAIGLFGGAMSSSTCKCGSSTFGGSFGYDSPSPAQFTADQMNERYLAGYEAGRASVADRGVRAVPGEPVAWQERQQVSPTQWSDWYERRSGWSLSRDQEIESSGIRYQFRPLYLATSVASPAAPASPVVQAPWREHAEQRMRSWRQSFVNKSGDQLALDDFMDERSLEDFIDYVLDEWAAPASPSVAQADQAVAAPCAEQCWACAESGIGCNLVNDGAVPSVLPAQEVAESFYVRFAKEWITADDKSREDIKGWVEGWYESDNTPAPAASAQPQAPQGEAMDMLVATPHDEWPSDADYALGHLAGHLFGMLPSDEIGHCVCLIRAALQAGQADAAARAQPQAPAGFWLAPMEPDEAMRRALDTGPGRWVYSNVETFQRMRDSWLERHPAASAQALGEAGEVAK